MSSGTLRRLLAAEGIPVDGIVGSSAPYTVDYAASATPEQITAGNAIASAFTDPPTPDWAGFRSALRTNPEWKRVLAADLVDASVLTSTLWQATSNPVLFTEVVALWDSLIDALDPPLNSTEIETINGLAIASNIPLSLATDGTMQVG